MQIAYSVRKKTSSGALFTPASLQARKCATAYLDAQLDRIANWHQVMAEPSESNAHLLARCIYGLVGAAQTEEYSSYWSTIGAELIYVRQVCMARIGDQLNDGLTLAAA